MKYIDIQKTTNIVICSLIISFIVNVVNIDTTYKNEPIASAKLEISKENSNYENESKKEYSIPFGLVDFSVVTEHLQDKDSYYVETNGEKYNKVVEYTQKTYWSFRNEVNRNLSKLL